MCARPGIGSPRTGVWSASSPPCLSVFNIGPDALIYTEKEKTMGHILSSILLAWIVGVLTVPSFAQENEAEQLWGQCGGHRHQPTRRF